jgi:hypothetical protein
MKMVRSPSSEIPNNDDSVGSNAKTIMYDETKVIRLNVGGTRYEFSRSLIEMYPDTMLGRSISKKWRGDESREAFIDRDGTRFQYVLDYMRDQKAHLAMNVSKDSILMELEYFGFANVDRDSIDDRKLNNKQALENVQEGRNQFSKRLTTIEKSLQGIKVDWVATKAASMVYDAQLHSRPSETKKVVFHQHDLDPIKYTLNEMSRYSDPIKSALNVILSDYGLSVSTIQDKFVPGRCFVIENIKIFFRMDPTP